VTPLRQRLIDELNRRNYSPRTVEAYVAGVARAARHFNRPPDQLSPDDLRAFQLGLIAAGTSGSQFNQVVSALRFFYRYVLERPEFVPFVVYGKKPRTLPVVLCPADVRRLLDAVPPGRNRPAVAATRGSPTTPVATGTAPSVAPPNRPTGCRGKPPTFCRWSTTTSCSRCLRR
jgi:integrase/recombinase XerD